MKGLLLAGILLLTTLQVNAKNLGHRLGGSAIKSLPENSLQVYRAVLLDLQNHKDFIYVEFDIQETLTGELIVMHDDNLQRMVPKETLRNIEQIPFTEIMKLCLIDSPKGLCYRIPTPKEVMIESVKGKLTKPIMIEIKNMTSIGKNNLIKTLNKYKNKLNLNIIISKKRFERMFTRKWCEDFSSNGYFVMETRKRKNPKSNNLCNQLTKEIKTLY